jgi:hypothetical protein
MGELTDTNSAWMAAWLPALGIELQGVSVIGLEHSLTLATMENAVAMVPSITEKWVPSSEKIYTPTFSI